MTSGEEPGHLGPRVLPSCGSSLLFVLFPLHSVIVRRRRQSVHGIGGILYDPVLEKGHISLHIELAAAQSCGHSW